MQLNFCTTTWLPRVNGLRELCIRYLVGQQGYFCNGVCEQPADILGMRVSISSALLSPQTFDQLQTEKCVGKLCGRDFLAGSLPHDQYDLMLGCCYLILGRVAKSHNHNCRIGVHNVHHMAQHWAGLSWQRVARKNPWWVLVLEVYVFESYSWQRDISLAGITEFEAEAVVEAGTDEQLSPATLSSPRVPTQELASDPLACRPVLSLVPKASFGVRNGGWIFGCGCWGDV